MEALATLSRELGHPGADKLYQATQRRGMDVHRDIVNAFVRQQSDRQVLAPRPKYEGKIIATRINDRWAADLIDYARGAGEYQYILLVQDIFSRKIWGVAMKDKTPTTTLGAFEHIVRSAGKPRELDTDQGAEFANEFQDYLDEEHIQHTMTDKRNKNARGTLDHAIKTVRQTLARLQLSTRKNWFELVSQAVHAWNENIHGNLIGRAPADIAGDPDAKFLLTEKAAEGLQINQQHIQKRGAALEREGAFRDELPATKRGQERSFKPKYSDEVHRVDKVVGGTVFSGDKPFSTRHVAPVPLASAPVNAAPLRAGNVQQDRAQLAALEPFRAAIKNFVSDGKWLHDVAAHMRGLGIVLRGINFKKALQLLGYKVAADGKVTLPRYRIRSKRAA